MFKAIMTWLEDRNRQFSRSFGKDITTPKGRFMGAVHSHVVDHAFLRILWTNFFEIAPGVYRSNHPSPRRLARYKALGIKTVVTLRGEEKFAHFKFEKEACEALGLEFRVTKLWARNATKRERLISVLDTFRDIEKPFVFHCKSGADRAGVVAAMYLMVFEGVPVEEARAQLGMKYLHMKWTKTGVQDYILDVYEARKNADPIDFETWLRTEYRAARLNDGWDAGATPAETAEMLRARALSDAAEAADGETEA
ncbi:MULTISPECIES: tyrosine-protein phosphatase [unclassified Marinovum]